MTLLAQVFTAYLSPLLKKHEEGKCIVWEDLEASYAATKEVMKSSDNIFVSVREDKINITKTKLAVGRWRGIGLTAMIPYHLRHPWTHALNTNGRHKQSVSKKVSINLMTFVVLCYDRRKKLKICIYPKYKPTKRPPRRHYVDGHKRRYRCNQWKKMTPKPISSNGVYHHWDPWNDPIGKLGAPQWL